MTDETRVGFMATSVLEEMTLDYVRKSVDEKGRYVGDVRYLTAYDNLKNYNSQINN